MPIKRGTIRDMKNLSLLPLRAGATVNEWLIYFKIDFNNAIATKRQRSVGNGEPLFWNHTPWPGGDRGVKTLRFLSLRAGRTPVKRALIILVYGFGDG